MVPYGWMDTAFFLTERQAMKKVLNRRSPGYTDLGDSHKENYGHKRSWGYVSQ